MCVQSVAVWLALNWSCSTRPKARGGVEGHAPVVLDVVVLLGGLVCELVDVLEDGVDESGVDLQGELDDLHPV